MDKVIGKYCGMVYNIKIRMTHLDKENRIWE